MRSIGAELQEVDGISGSHRNVGHVPGSLHFTATERSMIAQVPVVGVRTVCPVIGDLGGWATVVGFLPLLSCVVVEGRRAKQT